MFLDDPNNIFKALLIFFGYLVIENNYHLKIGRRHIQLQRKLRTNLLLFLQEYVTVLCRIDINGYP